MLRQYPRRFSNIDTVLGWRLPVVAGNSLYIKMRLEKAGSVGVDLGEKSIISDTFG